MRHAPASLARVVWVALVSIAFLTTSGCDCGARSLDDSDASVSDSGMEGVGGSGTGVGGAGNGGGSATGGGAGAGNSDGGKGGGDAGTDGGVDAGCPPVSCGTQCGPVRDFCSGSVLQCGGCPAGLVCSVATSLCITPEITCGDLSAQCGQIRNSCGTRLNCGACNDAGLECDRNTNQCVTCSSPSCADLGYQCGTAWLGCGPFTNVTDCGSCDAGLVCNSATNICDPGCTPGPTPMLCAAAGAQCGFITDGCGGQVDCGGCDAGTSCGARGIGNVCDLPEVPNECISANRNCGSYTSACGSPTLDCGTCTPPNICNMNGQCAPPCTPDTCASPAFMGVCGMGLDAGCGTTVDCMCGSSLNCTMSPMGVAGACVPDDTCATYGATGDAGAPCSIGPSPSFPENMTTNLACPCGSGGLCNSDAGSMMLAAPGDKGVCCFNSVACAMNECNTTHTNTCTGATLTCGCTMAGTHCDNSTDTCIMNNGCQLFTDGGAGSPCSTGASMAFPKGDGTFLTCPCSAPGAQCYSSMMVLPGGSPIEGACCISDTCPANSCAVITDHCSGNPIQCRCGANQFCATNGTCQADLTCASYSATGANGAVCSNGPSFPDGALVDGGMETDGGGVLLTCPCNGGEVCVNGTTVVSGAQRGSCCTNVTTCGNMCNVMVMNSCTGAMTACNCAGGNFCNGSNMCTPDFTCATYMANGAAGNVCSTTPIAAFPKGDGTDLTCNCNGGRVCSTAASGGTQVAAGQEGVCCTNTATCGNTCNTSVTNTCTGAAIPCTCGGGTFCSSMSGAGTCLPDDTCSTYGANGANGNPCSTTANAAFPKGDGTNLTCNCNGGTVCSFGGMTVTAGQEGACCTNTASCGNTCNTSVINTCTGATINCSCGAGNHCTNNPGAGTCTPDKSCSDYNATGAIGKACSTGPDSAFPGGPGGVNLTCPCSSGAPDTNNVCTGSSGTVAGTCTCAPSMPANCGDNGKSDGCGGTEVSTCGGGMVCYQNACCTSPVCPAGLAGQQCGVITACGQSTPSCMCTQMYQTCGAVTPNICGCKPKTLADCGVTLPAGQISPDGCGGTVNCPN